MVVLGSSALLEMRMMKGNIYGSLLDKAGASGRMGPREDSRGMPTY